MRGPRRRRPIRSIVPRLAVAVAVAAAALPTTPASATEPELIVGRPGVGEFQPVRGSGLLAWQQNSTRRPRHYDVVVRPVDGGSRFRVNPPGTNGANGDIEGTLLVYQEFVRNRSGLRFFDLTTHDRTNPQQGVNTEHWEYWPSMSGTLLLFGRLQANGVRRIILSDRATGTSRRLAKIQGSDAFLAPGQVNGDWAVWSRCPSASECNVIRYRISTGESVVLTSPGGRQYAPSVDREGTVYYVRAGGDCGRRARLMRQPLDGPAVELWRLPNGDDVGRTHAQVRPHGNTILFDQFSCGRVAESDAWSLVD